MNLIKTLIYPKYNESALFCIAYSFLLLLIFHEGVFSFFPRTLFDISKEYQGFKGIVVTLAAILFYIGFFYGLLLSIYHIFTKKVKKEFEKFAMFTFVILACLVGGFFSATYNFLTSEGFFKFVAFWNLLNVIVLFVLLKFKLIDENIIEDKDSNIIEALIGFVLISVIFYYAHFIKGIYWAVTFSICVLYSTNVNKFVAALINEPRYNYKE
jgi:hypothetical protein